MKPRVLVLADDPRWAWHYKAVQYRRWLSDEFDVEVGYRAHYYQPELEPAWDTFDLIHTFEFPQTDVIPFEYRGKLVTGLTAHVWRTWGEERVRRWASRCDALHANSLLLLAEITPFHERVRYTPNGVDPDFWARTRDRCDDCEVLFAHVGKPKEHKGYPLVPTLCTSLRVPLVTCYATAHNAWPPERLRELYLDSHAQIVYSQKDGTPCVALEAAACSNMIISNAIGNMPEFITPGVNGLLIDRTPAALIDALLWCGAHRDDVIDMGRAARARVLEAWTWEIQCEKVRALWREVLA